MKTKQDIPARMKAVVTYGPRDYRLESVGVPKPEPREILLKVEACGICAGDLKAFQGGKRFWGGGQFSQYIEEGCIGGHEFIGHIVSVGRDLQDAYQVGERVIAEQIVPCGSCEYCRKGLYWLCEPHEVFGFKRHLNGGFAEYMLIGEKSIVHRVPEGIPLEKAVLIEPLACSLHAIDRSSLQPDDLVVLSGCGALGLGMLAWMKAKYKVKVVALDLRKNRLDQAKKIGADYIFNPKDGDLKEFVDSLTNGIGCDVYLEATGHPDSVVQGLSCIRKQGSFVEFSVFNNDVTCDFSVIGDGKEIDIHGVSLSPYCYERTIRALEKGEIEVDGIVTHALNLDGYKQAFDLAESDSNAIKVILTPWGE